MKQLGFLLALGLCALSGTAAATNIAALRAAYEEASLTPEKRD